MDREKVEFHIAAGDYFGTLATTLDLLRRALEKDGLQETHIELLERLTADLVYLQQNHTLRAR